MSFYKKILHYEKLGLKDYFDRVTAADVRASIYRQRKEESDLLNMLSPAAEVFLEEMAETANQITRLNFGKTIGIYAPIYISDYCSNHCTYCGFNSTSGFERTKLTYNEIEDEAKALHELGIRHILVLTGEAPKITPLSYLQKSISILKDYFPSIALEIFPMDIQDYTALKIAGADSLTVYQETYDRGVYQAVHPKGKKRNFRYRLETPERAAKAGFRGVNIGALYGLGEVRKEAFFAGLHAHYLEKEFPDVEISLSLPRMTRAKGTIGVQNVLSDLNFVQFMLAWRLFMPRLGITISTRESASFRDKLVHLGATRYSAGSKTDVGGYSLNREESTVQFEITDNRSVSEVAEMIKREGYQPVFKDWEAMS